MSENWSRRMLDVGDRLAGYEVESFVARGGMAVVYRAHDLSLDRSVALKVIAPELASHDKFRQRFMRESELAASIDHPNIIPIYAAGEAEELLYLVMRYVEGDDLGTVLQAKGALRPREALPLFTQIAGALDAAHARGLVHRDVKPGNVLLSGNGDLAQRHVYLADFGLTKRLSSLTGFTTTGHFLGTIQYVAPEQVANGPVDHRTDIYSLACVIYEALVGEPPFVREDDAALLWSHMTQDPPLISTRRDGLPKTLDPVLAAALSKQPEDRPPNCRALVSGVRDAFRAREGVQGSAPRTVRPTAPRRSGAASASRSKPAEGEASRPQISQGLTAATTSARGGQGAAGKRGATAGAGGGRRPHLRLGALLLTLVLAVGLGSWWAVDRYWGWTAYSGREFEEAGVALEHPRTWVVRSHPGQFAVISPDDLTPVFTPSSSWATVERVAASDPDRLVGAYVNSTGWLNLGNALDPLGNQLKTRFSTSAKIEVDNRLPSGAPAGAQGVVGTMTPPDGSAAPRLYFEFVAIKTGGREGLVLLFCLEDQRAAQASTFERVLQSVRLP